MTFETDLHTHTVASTHALSTVHEMATQAHAIGLKALAITDHCGKMPDSAHDWHFNNIARLPDVLPNGLILLKGVEANALGPDGNIDLREGILAKLDWVIVSLHVPVIPSLSEKDSTQLWLNIANNPLVDMAGHPEQRQFTFDYDRVTKAFAQNNKVMEINAQSHIIRKGNEENMRRLAFFCKENGTKIAVNSDAHSLYSVGDVASVIPLLQEISFPQEQIVNATLSQLLQHLAQRKKPIAQRLSHLI